MVFAVRVAAGGRTGRFVGCCGSVRVAGIRARVTAGQSSRTHANAQLAPAPEFQASGPRAVGRVGWSARNTRYLLKNDVFKSKTGFSGAQYEISTRGNYLSIIVRFVPLCRHVGTNADRRFSGNPNSLRGDSPEQPADKTSTIKRRPDAGRLRSLAIEPAQGTRVIRPLDGSTQPAFDWLRTGDPYLRNPIKRGFCQILAQNR